MPFVDGVSFLEWIVERCKTSTRAQKVVVATTDKSKDDPIEVLCKEKRFEYIRGSEDDVLGRYWKAVQTFASDIVVRVTADNPFVDIPELDRLVDTLSAENLDYASNHPAGLPVGTGSEVFSSTAFEKVVAESKDPYEHEHVTPYFYRHPEFFLLKEVPPVSLHGFASSARLTLDTQEDLEFLRGLAHGMNIENPHKQPTTSEILDYLQRHPELVAINKDVLQKTFPKA